MYKDRKPQGVVDERASIDELKIHKQQKQQQNIPLGSSSSIFFSENNIFVKVN